MSILQRFYKLIASIVLLMTFLVTFPVTVVTPQQAGSSGEWVLYWSEEFNGPTINESIWNFEIGNGCPNLCGWGNNELEYYKKENAFIVFDESGNGYLVIEARKETVVDPVTSRTHYYTSARMQTRRKFEFQYGRIEGRIKLPEGKGIWPAFWLLGTMGGWPYCGEIDILELLGQDPTTVYGTAHSSNCYGGGGVGSRFRLPKGYKFSDDFHIFALEWTPNTIRWYVDGQLYHVASRKEYERRGCGWPFSTPGNTFFIILNVAVGGNWPGPPDDTTVFPQRMYVDYVRVYKCVGGSCGDDVYNENYDSDNELLVRSIGWPLVSDRIANPDFDSPVDLTNSPAKNPDDWFLVQVRSGLVDLGNSGVSQGVMKIKLLGGSNDADDVRFGRYLYMWQGYKYRITLRAWSDAPKTAYIKIVLPSNPPKVYAVIPINISTEPSEFVFDYVHPVGASNVVYVYIALGGAHTTVFVDYFNVEKIEPVGAESSETMTTTLTTPQKTITSTYTQTVTEEFTVVKTRTETAVVTTTATMTTMIESISTVMILAIPLIIGLVIGYLIKRR